MPVRSPDGSPAGVAVPSGLRHERGEPRAVDAVSLDPAGGRLEDPRLAGAGFEVIGTGRNTARVTAPTGVTYLDLDVTSDESVASVVKQVIDRFGRIDVLVNNVSSLSGFVPSPFMAIYTSTKHAVEDYSGSLDHEVREHGIRILLVEPGPINTPFGDHSVQGDTPLPLYASGRRTFDEVLAKTPAAATIPLSWPR